MHGETAYVIVECGLTEGSRGCGIRRTEMAR